MRVLEFFFTLICALCALGGLALGYLNAKRKSNIEHIKQLEAENEYIDHFNSRFTKKEV